MLLLDDDGLIFHGIEFRQEENGFPIGKGEIIMMMNKSGPLERAIDQQSAEWLEAVSPNVYDALAAELAAGQKIEDIKRILRRKFGYDLRDAFVLRVIQAARFMSSEMVTVGR